ncbi:hypothetical protein PF008_g3561 [Phytophthora fragariae]|uniref:Retrotransposon gag domain-containing protein n=1 Tax=Phytophthora fragariae TaxID=53985 RepID=A0A6G0SED7_9STRA|nr:hypothetical protein PF008_g3561 [Phytophthora fragariae]
MEPSDNISSWDSSDGDSDSSSPVYSAATNTMGDTSVTFKPYMYPTGLEDFDEDAPLHVRKRRWERFVHLAIQCGWSNMTELYELKLKVSPAVRDWRGRLPKHERRDWGGFSKRFKREFCRSKVSDAESYYTMTQDKDEKALAFLHRLNLAGERAGVDFQKNSRGRQQHVRPFVKNVSDDQLKLTLRGHRFR